MPPNPHSEPLPNPAFAQLPSDCTLEEAQGRSRVGAWVALRHVLRSNTYSNDRNYLHLRFDGSPEVADTVRRLAAEEAHCCRGATFAVEERNGETILTIGRDANVMAAFARLEPRRPG